MARRVVLRLLAAALTLAALVAALSVLGGNGYAQSSAAEANYAPTNTTLPSISGTSQVGQTLTGNIGAWSSQTTPTYRYQWLSCDTNGNNCAVLPGANSPTYGLQSADQGHTIRLEVTASTSSGSTSATSNQTAVVSVGAGGTVPASSVSLPNRLVIDGVKFTPGALRNRNAFVGRIHVSDSQGNNVSGALVMITPLPYAWASAAGEVSTDQSGWATLTITPHLAMPVAAYPTHYLVMFVRARVQGQDPLAGSSVRRLVQITIR